MWKIKFTFRGIFENKIDRKSNNSSYHYSQIIIHWLVALLVVYQFTFGGNIEFLELESCINSKTNVLKSCQYLNNHYLVGVIIFLLMIVRLFLRILFGAPPLPKSIPLTIKIFARLSHYLIYLILFSRYFGSNIPVYVLSLEFYDERIYRTKIETQNSRLLFSYCIHYVVKIVHWI